jgi:alkylation response protein AidB-like acyl-CoA dehydrogenase
VTGLVLSEEQELLQRTALDLVHQRAPIAELRRLRDSRDPIGFSRELWQAMAELGFAGILIPEAYGGAGLGHAELGVVLEACGRTLAATPLLSTALLGVECLRRGGDESLQRERLPALARGEHIVALALDEGPHFAPYRVDTRATADGSGFLLTGAKRHVLDGHVADEIVVVARTSGTPGEREGLGVFRVPKGAQGLSVTRVYNVDSRNAARVALDRVRVERAALLGEIDRGADLIDPVLDRAATGLAAEMLGSATEIFERTIAHLLGRRQFGVPIGSFQALQHRAAWMHVELELTRSAVLDALRAIDAGSADVPRLACVAKARANETFDQVAREAIQMHGGIGMTDEADVGLFLKRARVTQVTFGDANHHRDRFATLCGF